VNLFSQQQLSIASPQIAGPRKVRTLLSWASRIANTNQQQSFLDKKNKQSKIIFVYLFTFEKQYQLKFLVEIQPLFLDYNIEH
jgi:hypothetical protein